MENILILGADGYIASHFLHIMHNKYPTYNFIGIDINSFYMNHSNFFQYYKFDIALMENFYELYKIIENHNITLVINFAAYSSVDGSYRIYSTKKSYLVNNVNITTNILNQIKQFERNNNTKKIKYIHISTDEVYGPSKDINDIKKEDAILNPTNPYSISKTTCEYYCNFFKNAHNLNITIIRPNNIYGYIKTLHARHNTVIQIFKNDITINKCKLYEKDNTHIDIHGTGNQTRNFLHVCDFIDAIDIIIHRGSSYIYNVGSDNNISILDLALKMKQLLNSDINIVYTIDRPYQDMNYFIDSSEIKALGWCEKMNFDEELNNICNK